MIAMTRNRKSGFTLMEILVVLVITMILMGLVMWPLIRSFELMKSAQTMVDSQNSARAAMAQISRELGQAMYVYDNSASPVTLPVWDRDRGHNDFTLRYAKIDMVLPKVTMHCNRSDHNPNVSRDYSREDPETGIYEAWPLCPSCLNDGLDVKDTDVEAQPKIPLEQDTTVVRYFLGLRYNNIDDTVKRDASVTTNRGWASPYGDPISGDTTANQVVLYRAEFNVYDNNLFPAGMSVADRLADPDFFYRKGYTDAWSKVATVVGIGKYEDLVIITEKNDDKSVRALEPTVTFRSGKVTNDAFTGKTAYTDAAPTLFTGTHGYWTDSCQITLKRGNEDVEYTTKLNNRGRMQIFKCVKAGNGVNETPEFDIDTYKETGDIREAALARPLTMAFTVDMNRGAADFAVTPPLNNRGSVCTFNPDDINTRFHDKYETNRGGARRVVSVFDGVDDNYMRYADIVPGSDIVTGPNMIVGSNYGKKVRYERVLSSFGDPGINQYKIDYATGDLFFSSVLNEDLPTNENVSVDVFYKVQYNYNDDLVCGTYYTKSVIDIHMGMRLFDSQTLKPYPVNLNTSVKVRNAIR